MFFDWHRRFSERCKSLTDNDGKRKLDATLVLSQNGRSFLSDRFHTVQGNRFDYRGNCVTKAKVTLILVIKWRQKKTNRENGYFPSKHLISKNQPRNGMNTCLMSFPVLFVTVNIVTCKSSENLKITRTMPIFFLICLHRHKF